MDPGTSDVKPEEKTAAIGSRKVKMFYAALASVFAGFTIAVFKNGVPDNLYSTFAWAVAGLTTTALGWNVGEHWAKNRPGAKGDDK